MSIIDHTGITVTDYARSKAFYEKVLSPLGIRLLKEFGPVGGFGIDKPDFWISVGPSSYQRPEHLEKITPQHIAFSAKSRAEVDEFYAAALQAGGKDFGKPGIREMYHPSYYGAFVLDPDGHNIEAVVHR